MVGMSAFTIARKVGAEAAPVVGPAKNTLADCVLSENERAGVVDAVATLVVNSGERFPDENVVTVPLPPPLGLLAIVQNSEIRTSNSIPLRQPTRQAAFFDRSFGSQEVVAINYLLAI